MLVGQRHGRHLDYEALDRVRGSASRRACAPNVGSDELDGVLPARCADVV